MPFKGKKTNYRKRKTVYRRRPKKKTVDQKIKTALKKQIGKEVHQFVDYFGLKIIEWAGGLGRQWHSAALEGLPTGTSLQTRIGNRIKLLGIRLNGRVTFQGFSVAPDFETATDQSQCTVKLCLLQLKEKYDSDADYIWPNVKCENQTSGAIFSDVFVDVDAGNNSANRDRWNIVWEKRFLLGQALSAVISVEGTPNPVVINTNRPNEIKFTKFIKSKKLMDVLWSNVSTETGTRHGGFVWTCISDQDAAANFTAPYFVGQMTYYFEP